MQINPKESNSLLDSALNYHFPEYSEEQGIQKVVAFGDHSHKCPIYVKQTPSCTAGCPAGNDIRAWLTLVQHSEKRKRSWQESYELAWHEASKTTPFPAVCGRVCPHPCETKCNRSKKDDGAVNISSFERFIGDYGIRAGLRHKKLTTEIKDKKIAIIGAGPAGLSCAFQLARRGFQATVFEAFAQPGGMLRYGIPPYRLPRNILDGEIDAIVKTGVKIICNTVIGIDKSLDQLAAEFDKIFIGIGAHKGVQLGVAGEEAPNVFSAVRFLRMINSGEPVQLGTKVLVVGGGHSALVIARVARRLGAEVTVLYRRTIVEMPATEEEVSEALDEGVEIRYLIAPVGIRTENGRAVAVLCTQMKLGDLDKTGRRRPIPVEDSHIIVECTALILAISQRPDWKDAKRYVSANGWLKPDKDWSIDESMYAGGDVISPDRVTTAIGHGRLAAERIAASLEGKPFQPPNYSEIITEEKLRLSYYEKRERNERHWMPVNNRFDGTIDLEIDFGITEEQFRAEALRCMSCGLCFECNQCMIYCPQHAISEFPDNPVGQVMYTDYTKCIGCHICALTCPCGYIQMGMGEGL
ncbi:NAD(P)-binding protein [Desulforhopalus sp. IMCC35007]|uniref:NAD(P)-binding protein n=1 Tax=Desulforhopalus sp. IMCC35007 TaxID=2569543 RepID=UPI0010AE486C|nr:NAD(P)-binding protein [Desulforhopalus sp. IMCC35007]TKB06393.1 FAD-dependent oxidoreductase [Desulforhopalus sp. IMCC35007]